MTEAQWQSLIRSDLRQMQCATMHLHDSRRASGGQGFPDLIVRSRHGQLLAAELKAAKGQATAQQIEWLTAFRDAGIPAHLWRPQNREQILAWLAGDWQRIPRQWGWP